MGAGRAQLRSYDGGHGTVPGHGALSGIAFEVLVEAALRRVTEHALEDAAHAIKRFIVLVGAGSLKLSRSRQHGSGTLILLRAAGGLGSALRRRLRRHRLLCCLRVFLGVGTVG